MRFRPQPLGSATGPVRIPTAVFAPLALKIVGSSRSHIWSERMVTGTGLWPRCSTSCTGPASVALSAAGPWLAWLPIELIERLPGAWLRSPLAFG